MEKTALLIIDIQNDYFPGGKFEQDGAEKAADNAALALKAFRSKALPVIHIRHENLNPEGAFFTQGSKGAEINQRVTPNEKEKVIIKHYPNSFRETTLGVTLKETGITKLIVCGMMTLMCVDATVRAAKDLGYEVTVLHDACAGRALEFNGIKVPADHVQAAFLAALEMSYANVTDTVNLISKL